MFLVSQLIILEALILSPQNTGPQIPDIRQVHFTQNVRTEQAEALGGLADCAQGLLSVLSGRHPSRSIRIVSTESLLSRNSDSPPPSLLVRSAGGRQYSAVKCEIVESMRWSLPLAAGTELLKLL